jgi:AraC family transcriptional regulator of adaptative response/methylated-DNA-[protein]-cysteine methyltransferase
MTDPIETIATVEPWSAAAGRAWLTAGRLADSESAILREQPLPALLLWSRHDTAFGPVLVAVDGADGAIGWLSFLQGHDSEVGLAAVRRAWPQARLAEDAAAGQPAVERAFAPVERLTVALGTGTGFQRTVWRALTRIPRGAVVSYGQIATAIGHPAAVRAVGSAVGANPVSVLVPCHRVIQASGALGNYGGGIDRKRALLAWERATGGYSPSTSAML